MLDAKFYADGQQQGNICSSSGCHRRMTCIMLM